MIDFRAMTVAELRDLKKKSQEEILARQNVFITNEAAKSKLTKEERRKYAMAGQASFVLPLVDWAAVEAEGRLIDHENNKKYGFCARFQPLISIPESGQTEEYKELFIDPELEEARKTLMGGAE